MKTYFYFLFFLSLSLAAQNKDAQKRLYYNPMEGEPAYAMGKYEVRIQVYEEAFDTLVTKQNMVNFAKKNHFLDTIPSGIQSCHILIIILLIILKMQKIIGKIRWFISSEIKSKEKMYY